MRARHGFSVTIPLPSNLPPAFLIGWLQRYTPTLEHNFSVFRFFEIPTDQSSIDDDPYMGPCDATVRTFHCHELYVLNPGLTTSMDWPIAYRSVPNGIRLRVSAPNGNVIRSQWIVRLAQDQAVAHSTSEPPSNSTDKWELYDEGYLEGNRLIMAFSSRYIDMVHDIQSKSIIEAALHDYVTGPPT